MSTTTPGADQLQALISYANNKTGESDTTLSDAVTRLVNGYSGESLPEYYLECIYNDKLKLTGYIWHGGEILPGNCFRNLEIYNSGSSTDTFLTFSTKPKTINQYVFFSAKVNLDWSQFSDVEVIKNGAFRLSKKESQANVIVTMPKVTGIDCGEDIFAGLSSAMPSTFIFSGMTYIPRSIFGGLNRSGLNVTFGSLGCAITGCALYPFYSTKAGSSAVITVYTTGEYIDNLHKTTSGGLEFSVGYGDLTFIYKASEATTYNGTSYAANEVILTSRYNATE